QVPVPDNANNIFGNKFCRRPELTIFDRLQIVYDAYCAKIFDLWGTISALSRYYNMSRTFIYDTLAVFEEVVELALGPSVQPADTDKKKADCYRFEKSINYFGVDMKHAARWMIIFCKLPYVD
ncbi:MAG: hypothetical protein D3925_07845, partial [Candidatus Electrothrix sp. AR5]|nr:hypothetical protein [Candidatus Electrothrix sp. AR5]